MTMTISFRFGRSSSFSFVVFVEYLYAVLLLV